MKLYELNVILDDQPSYETFYSDKEKVLKEAKRLIKNRKKEGVSSLWINEFITAGVSQKQLILSCLNKTGYAEKDSLKEIFSWYSWNERKEN